MTPSPQDEATEPKDLAGVPLDAGDAARHLVQLTGMSADSAKTFAEFHSGRHTPFYSAA